MNSIFTRLLFVVFALSPIRLSAKTFSPFDFGYASAKTGEERYEVLYRTHEEAIKRGGTVDYSGFGTIELAIPAKAKSIPLPYYCDFKGTTFIVENKEKNIFLFSLQAKEQGIEIPKHLLGADKSGLPMLSGRNVLLSVNDGNPWVQNRKGYEYGATRRDMIIVKNGMMKNLPVMPYDNDVSSPVCSIYPLTKKKKTIKNVSLIRSDSSLYKTFLLQVDGQYNVSVSGVRIVTPESALNADKAISVTNSAKIRFNDIVIEGTYSHLKESGYGIQMNNVYDVSFKRMKADAAWGVFGTNNVHYARLTDCDINRFDIHCYGRDVFFKDCTFRNIYNQFSSVFGTINFTRCEFIDCCPVLIEYSYNAYTGFDLVLEKCLFKPSASKNYIINAGFLDDDENARPELRQKCWPNVYINGLRIDAPEDVKTVYLFRLRKPATTHESLGYVTSLQLDNISFVGQNRPELMITNYDIPVRNAIRVTQRRPFRSSIVIKDNLTKVKN